MCALNSDIRISNFLGNNFRDSRRWRVLILGLLFISFTITLFWMRKYPDPSASLRLVTSPNSVCASYTRLYYDAIATQDYFRQRGGITWEDYMESQKNCQAYGECIQVKLFNGNLFIGNVSENPRCPEPRGMASIMSLFKAIEQSRMEGEILPNIDVYLQCADSPSGNAATWYLTKTRDNAAADPNHRTGLTNFFLMPDFSFFAWPQTYTEPWT